MPMRRGPSLNRGLGSTWPFHVAALVLIAASLLQWQTLARSLHRELQDARAVSVGASVQVRSGYLLFSPSFGDYVAFMRREIPESARVVLPPRDSMFPYTHVGLMQYFLFPREVVNCGVGEVEACLERVRGPGNYLVAVGRFPPQDQAQATKQFISFDDERGLYAPR